MSMRLIPHSACTERIQVARGAYSSVVSTGQIVKLFTSSWCTYHLSQLNNTWGSPEFAHCELNFTFRELRNRYKESRPPNFKTGGLGPLMQPGRYEVWLCVEDHYCSIHPTDKFFCWVLDETKVKSVGEVAPDQWVPWNHHAHLQLVH